VPSISTAIKEPSALVAPVAIVELEKLRAAHAFWYTTKSNTIKVSVNPEDSRVRKPSHKPTSELMENPFAIENIERCLRNLRE
jgi:hypothetical protein